MRKFLIIITTLILSVMLFYSSPFTLLFKGVIGWSCIIGMTIYMRRTKGIHVTFQQKFFEILMVAFAITFFVFISDKNLLSSLSKNSTAVYLFITSALSLILGKEVFGYLNERHLGQSCRQILGGPMTRSENRR